MVPLTTLDKLAKLTDRLCSQTVSETNLPAAPAHPKSIVTKFDKTACQLLEAILTILHQNQSPLVSKVEDLIRQYGYSEADDEQ